jgi:alpha-galactosidase
MKLNSVSLLLTLLLALRSVAFAEEVGLSATGVTNVRQAENERARPVLDKNAKNGALRVAGRDYAGGLGTQVETRLAFDINGAQRFRGLAGVDDATVATAPVAFEILADGESLWRHELKKGDAPLAFDLSLAGKKQLVLVTADIGNNDSEAFADWLDAKFAVEGGVNPKSTTMAPVAERPVILTPKPPAEPRITGARVFGARPGHPFLYTVTATGERPMTFSTEGLPAGLSIDGVSGRITGSVERAGTHVVTVRASNARGTDEKKLRLEIGERIELTPALGWNSWNCWGPEVDADKVRQSARAMVGSGLIHHGWTYINIDDAWQAPRGGKFGAIQGNQKFPDLKGLADEIHGLGLKMGIYSTPWITSYAGYVGGSANNPEGTWEKPAPGTRTTRGIGKYSFATNDAKQWADWGVDYLKYDWNPNQLPETAEMWSALRTSGRDIVFSLSNSMPFQNIPELSHVANSWRTTGDIQDQWGSIMKIGFSQDRWRPFGGPGHWNDPDMLVVGYVDVGKGVNLHPTRLTPNEQVTHISLWCLQSAPLLIGCDMERLDEFTLSLLENDEVLAIDQDELGRPAAQAFVDGRRQAWVKELADGSRAIGLFNLSQAAQEISVDWDKLGLKGPQRVRDLWRQQDLGVQPAKFSATVPRHGAVLIRVWPAK